MQATYDALLADLTGACRQHYRDRLLSVAVYGSVARGMPRPDSDVDLLVVAQGLAERHASRPLRGMTNTSLAESYKAGRAGTGAAGGCTILPRTVPDAGQGRDGRLSLRMRLASSRSGRCRTRWRTRIAIRHGNS